MNERQETLFDEDRQREELTRLEGQVRHKAGELKDELKQCSGYMSLLKDGPKNVTDIMFRCQNTELAQQTLQLLMEQARELSNRFEDCMKIANQVAQWESSAAELRTQLKIEEKVNGTIEEIDEDDDDDFDDAAAADAEELMEIETSSS